MASPVVALRFAARSDLGLGPKSRNEDSGYAGPNLLVLADGMGGHAAGDVASSMIVGELAPLDEEDVTAEQAVGLLEEALRRANAALTAAVRDNDELVGMGSTTIAVLRAGNKVAMAHIGDSRAFLLRGDALSQLTKDHSFVQQLVDEGRIAPEEAGAHPQRSVVTRVMTGQPDDQPDTSLREARVGDRFLLCSDGLTDFVGADVIEEILREARSPDEAADRCIEVALRASSRDNVTVIVADVVSGDSADLPTTTPQVVGAASSRLGKDTRALPTTPAAKAAALSREATGREEEAPDDKATGAEPARRSRGSRAVSRGLGAVVVAGILGGGGYAAYAWSQQQYFVAAHDGHVAIFRGVSQSLGPISLSRLDSQTEVLVDDLPSDVQGSVAGSISARDLADAQAKVTTLRSEAARCKELAGSGTPCGTTTGVSATTTPATSPGSPTSSGSPTSTSGTPTPGPTTPPTTSGGGATTAGTLTTTPTGLLPAPPPSGIPPSIPTLPDPATVPTVPGTATQGPSATLVVP